MLNWLLKTINTQPLDLVSHFCTMRFCIEKISKEKITIQPKILNANIHSQWYQNLEASLTKPKETVLMMAKPLGRFHVSANKISFRHSKLEIIVSEQHMGK